MKKTLKYSFLTSVLLFACYAPFSANATDTDIKLIGCSILPIACSSTLGAGGSGHGGATTQGAGGTGHGGKPDATGFTYNKAEFKRHL
ncbi:hypothetical protein ALT761_01972 [Alteromonas sp. 76-1]|uniref:hypothetical protein n=1 Tax=Alteromonas sp. 76-1 TaxID=2358187 RepID=UPI000FD16ABC|nr:hypothetical protein [Alteromonas sp. 76-1]VEL96973.1 hypothetical protein ALT761_01972 [Alteromonas sp. 76-1]